jgi:zinc transporter ZupT
MPYHIIPPLAIVFAALAGAENPSASLILTGFSTGTFLYIGAFEVICEEFAEHSSAETNTWVPAKWQKFLSFVLGSGIQMGLLAAIPGGEHVH